MIILFFPKGSSRSDTFINTSCSDRTQDCLSRFANPLLQLDGSQGFVVIDNEDLEDGINQWGVQRDEVLPVLHSGQSGFNQSIAGGYYARVSGVNEVHFHRPWRLRKFPRAGHINVTNELRQFRSCDFHPIKVHGNFVVRTGFMRLALLNIWFIPFLDLPCGNNDRQHG